jgi:hypothetical protein
MACGAPYAHRTTPSGQPILDYEAVYPAGHPYEGAPILRLTQGTETVHNELNAIITGTDRTGFPGELPNDNPIYPNRGKAFREFTIAFHDEVKIVQAFPAWFEQLKFTLGAVKDGFAVNYGTGGIGSEIIGNRLGVGPMKDCVECKYEEFFLTSWTVGDPAMIVDIPANRGLEACNPALANCADIGGKATKAFYPDDPANVWHGYLNDRTKVRNIHVGTEHHIFHLHAHQWGFAANDEGSNYLDAQAIGPGSSFTYEIAFGGGGNRAKSPGDSIFHCHFYPHFAQGMWGLWRVHDVFERGTVMGLDGRPAPGSRALPDGEIAAGTPIPGVVPVPGTAMAPMPEVDVTVVGGEAVVAGTGESLRTAAVAGNPGFPFFIPGVAGHRPPTPPMDLVADGGLPRHVIIAGTADATQTPTDFDKVLLTATGFEIPEAGTPAEQAAMAFHGPQDPLVTGHEAFHDTYLPDGNPVSGTSGFQINGLEPQMSAPYADPCRADVWTNSVSNLWSPSAIGNPRTYKASVIELDVDLNKVGWHFGQQRIIVLDEDIPATLAGTRAPEPFVMRANTGDCVDFDHTNRVPNVYQLDDFQVKTPTDVIGQHIHLVKFDVMTSDGAANGWNYEDGTLSADEVTERLHALREVGGSWAGLAGETALDLPLDATGFRTTRQRWFLDPGWMGNVFTHDHYGPSTHQQAGLYATLLVEPEGSIWKDPVTGAEFGTRLADGGPTSWKADIDCTGCSDPRWTGDAWREFYLEFADFQVAYRGQNDGGLGNEAGTPINPSDRVEVGLPFILASNPATCGVGQCRPEAISAADPGTFVVNYRNEPLALRVRDPNTNTQALGLAGDLSYAFHSNVDREDDRLDKPPIDWPYNSLGIQTPNQGALAGDPFTPMLQVYEGDKVMVRVQVGAHEEGHNFSINGIRWLQQWNSGYSGFRNSQMAGISEYFIFEVPALGRVQGGQEFEDFLYQTGSSVDARWNGSWGLMRSYGGPTAGVDLQTLPTNADGQVPPGNNADFAGMCPAGAPNTTYAVAAVSAADVLPDLAGVRPGDAGFAGGTLVYNSRAVNGGPLHDPTALMYVLESDLEPVDPTDPLCIEPRGNPRKPKERIDVMKPGCRVRLRADAPVEPLILRANAGDCLRVELFNKLLGQAVDAIGAPVFTCDPANPIPVFQDQGAGLCLADGTLAAGPITFDGPFDLDGFNSMPMIVEQFNANQVTPSVEVGLHAQLVSYTMSEGDGNNVGFNNVQTAAPGGKAEYVWYAGNIETDPETGFRTPIPVEFGAINLMASDPIKGSNKGLIGGLVVEPTGSTWQCDAGFANNGNLRLVDCYGGGRQGLPTTRAAATVSIGNNGPSFRDFVAIYQDDVNLRFGDAVSLPGINDLGVFTNIAFAAGDPVPTVSAEEEPEDSGGKGLNYRTEPSWFRLGYAPTGNPNFTRTIDYTDVWSNAAVGSDPETPVFLADAGQEVRFRLLKPGGHNRNQVFTLHGHLWPRHPYNFESTEIDPNNQNTFWHGEQMGHGPSNHVNVVPLNGAGGYYGATGDYLFRDMTPVHVDNGEWGILRVE